MRGSPHPCPSRLVSEPIAPNNTDVLEAHVVRDVAEVAYVRLADVTPKDWRFIPVAHRAPLSEPEWNGEALPHIHAVRRTQNEEASWIQGSHDFTEESLRRGVPVFQAVETRNDVEPAKVCDSVFQDIPGGDNSAVLAVQVKYIEIATGVAKVIDHYDPLKAQGGTAKREHAQAGPNVANGHTFVGALRRHGKADMECHTENIAALISGKRLWVLARKAFKSGEQVARHGALGRPQASL